MGRRLFGAEWVQVGRRRSRSRSDPPASHLLPLSSCLAARSSQASEAEGRGGKEKVFELKCQG